MPSHVHVTKSTELDVATGQTNGMVRKGAIIKKSNKLCASVMTAAPHTSSAIHHHGEQDTIVYAASGHGAIISDNGQTRQELAPGDFALIPAWTEHQEVNDGEEEVTWIITRSGGEPVVVNLRGWGEGTKE
ncbi:RmlC-like cupin domain-containing protein [Rhexocercosporidium sp. MPI-PUGE-AT-0058]|nr:RmlC-like cupin domain-containing protein [Rhexocercosporidium sp. MPI-PUGE-AT-0058]